MMLSALLLSVFAVPYTTDEISEVEKLRCSTMVCSWVPWPYRNRVSGRDSRSDVGVRMLAADIATSVLDTQGASK